MCVTLYARQQMKNQSGNKFNLFRIGNFSLKVKVAAVLQNFKTESQTSK